MTKRCGWFRSPDNVPLKAAGPACFLGSSSFLALPLLLWNSWPFPSISELSLSWFPQVSFLASWWRWGQYRVGEEARKPAIGSRAGPSDISSAWSGKDQRVTESQRSEQCWLQEDGFQGASVLQWLSLVSLTKEGGWRVWLFLTELCGDLGRWENCVCIGPFFKQGEIG